MTIPAPPAGPGRPRSRLRQARLAAIVAAAAVVVAALVLLARVVFPPRPVEPFRPQAAEASGPPAAPQLAIEKITVPARSTLADLLKRRGFTDREIHDLGQAVKPVYDLAKIRAGQELRLASIPDGSWQRLEYDVDETRYLVVDRDGAGIRAEMKYVPVEYKTAFVAGVIEDSLIAALNKAGEEDSLAIDLVERCFGWDIDFNTDLRRGDAFRICFERRYLGGRPAGYRDILAAEFVNEGKIYRAFRFTYPDTKAWDYFDENGGSRRKDFLRSPIKLARITSRFSSGRFHPIHKIYRPHYGVDYAAPIGTPVQATADGEVTSAGREAGSGNIVRMRHKNAYQTAYLHLSRFGPGVRRGAVLRGGDVVGYVGSTGDSTGPHLDYRIYFHGSPVNPLGHKFKPADPLRKEYLEDYRKEAARLGVALRLPEILRAASLIPALSF
ncbi:MAG TPA: peptidoglycan DD-metalloendopeptidase family protein [Candidatus Aminicenantes bacterium]|nr:peptidoglycan DD-metalloendopeptidase family protein [Candidatus Aminicenantes bacterium]HRY65086.1 peptidoglycan DD-metalloendopeptidase family protein [Candidatus Aminicenantes bacterium]HRZ71999.1 peptidoglycan DD-metalloendopeptidase family protein [Candidatus Aminicenantes bacterium]